MKLPWPVIFFVLCGVAVLLFLILQCRISLEFRGAAGSAVSPRFHIHIKAGPLVLFRFRYPKKKRKKKRKKKKKKKPTAGDIFYLIKKYGKTIEITELCLRGSGGIGDAHATAIGVGLAYQLLGGIAAAAGNCFCLKHCDLNLTPAFNTFGFFLRGDCIVRFKIVNIISAAFTAWRLRMKGRK